MKTSQFLLLLFVSAIWGASHSLIRIAVPEWGSAVTTILRIGIAAVTLIVLLLMMKKRLNFRENFKQFLIVGFLNASFPIFLFAYAAKSLPASYLVILNASTPVFNAILSSLFLNDPFSFKKVLGVSLGIGGIVMLEQRGTIGQIDSVSGFAMFCTLLASACYGMSAVYLKKSSRKIDPIILTAGSNVIGVIFLAPFAIGGDWHWAWNAALPSILILGVLGSGFAFVIYYGLLQQIGAFRASLSTFILPVFGLFWSWLFLDEKPNAFMMIGVVMIVSATSLFLKREPIQK